MTVSSTTNRVEYTANGVTRSFSFPYLFLANADLRVVIRDPATGDGDGQTLDVDYTVTGAGNSSGGSVAFGTPPANGLQVIIFRDPDLTQPVENINGDNLDVETGINTPLDRATLDMQRLAERAARAFGIPRADLSSVVTTVPNQVERANTVFCFDASGNVECLPKTDFTGGGGGFTGDNVTGILAPLGNPYIVTIDDAFGYREFDTSAADAYIKFDPLDGTIPDATEVRFAKSSPLNILYLTTDGTAGTIIHSENSVGTFTARKVGSNLRLM